MGVTPGSNSGRTTPIGLVFLGPVCVAYLAYVLVAFLAAPDWLYFGTGATRSRQDRTMVLLLTVLVAWASTAVVGMRGLRVSEHRPLRLLVLLLGFLLGGVDFLALDGFALPFLLLRLL